MQSSPQIKYRDVTSVKTGLLGKNGANHNKVTHLIWHLICHLSI